MDNELDKNSEDYLERFGMPEEPKAPEPEKAEKKPAKKGKK